MGNEILDLKEVNTIQGKSTTIDNVIGETKIKVYPYVMINTNENKAVFQSNTTSIISIDNDPKYFDESNIGYKKDSAGQIYFTLVVAYDVSGNLININTTSVSGQSRKMSPSFNGITLDMGMKSFKNNMVFFFNEPYMEQKFNNDEQNAYLASDIKDIGPEALNSLGIDTMDEVNESVVEVSFIDLDLYKNQFVNADFNFFKGDFKSLDVKLDSKDGLEIDMSNSALLHSIKAKVQRGTNNKDVSLKLEKGLIPFKMTPIDRQDRVTMFADWFDYDVAMPLYLANLLVTPKTLTQLAAENIPGSTNKVFTDVEKNLIEDIIAISYAYATRWKGFPRYTVEEAKQITGVKPGDIKGDTSIGNSKIKVASLVNKQPLAEIDILIEAYVRENPSKETSTDFRTFKQLLAGLSRYVYTSYSIGKGQNSFAKIYLPWYLQPVSPLHLEADGTTGFKLGTDITFKFESEWFEYKDGKVSIKDYLNISDVRMIQTDRKLTIPSVPDEINGLSKIPLPGDISTTTSRDLMYMWYLPIYNDAEFNKLFLDKAEIVTSDSTELTFDSEWVTEDWYGDPGYISELLDNKYGAGNYKVISYGVKESRHVETGSKTLASDVYVPITDWSAGHLTSQLRDIVDHMQNGWTQADIPPYDPSWPANDAIFSWPTVVRKYFSNNILGQGFNTNIELTDDHSKNLPVMVNDHAGKFGITFRAGTYNFGKAEFRTVGTKYKLTAPVKTANIDRDTLYTKDSWNNFIHFYLNLSTSNNRIKLFSEYGEDLSNLEEITITSLWNDKFKLIIGGREIEIDAINSKDETVAIQRILFT